MIDPLWAEQMLNGLQLGVMLFLMAAGLTLVFGIMDVINLAHGSFYMLGAFLTATFAAWLGAYVPALMLAMTGLAVVGAIVDRLALRRLYGRDHLAQVLATFGLILFFNEGVRLIWGPQPLFLDPPAFLAGAVPLGGGIAYPAFRLAILAMGLAVGMALWLAITRTRFGMQIRAAATHRDVLAAMGCDVARLSAVVFALGAALAALAGGMAGPILAVREGMGEDILILTFVVIVIGGLGSVRGAALGAILVGMADTLIRAFLPGLMGTFLGAGGTAAGAAIASIGIYLVMAAVLLLRPQGLFGRPA